MKLSGRGRLAAVGVACVAMGATFGPTFATAANTLKDVVVTNTDDQPVPTKALGTTQVGGTVNIGNTPSVTVGNTNPIPVAVASGGASTGTPITRDFEIQFYENRFATSDTYTVPQGKRLEIDFVSLSDGGASFVTVEELVGHVGNTRHWFEVKATDAGHHIVSQPARIISTSTVRFTSELSENAGSGGNLFTLHGTWVGTLYDA